MYYLHLLHESITFIGLIHISRALPSTLSGTHLQDLENFLSLCFFPLPETRFLSLVPESAVNQDTGKCPWILVHSRFSDQGQEPVPAFLKRAGNKQTTFPHSSLPIKVQCSSDTHPSLASSMAPNESSIWKHFVKESEQFASFIQIYQYPISCK